MGKRAHSQDVLFSKDMESGQLILFWLQILYCYNMVENANVKYCSFPLVLVNLQISVLFPSNLRNYMLNLPLQHIFCKMY